MKTKKFLMLLAAVLLSCASAMAQNSPLKGDVNGDGKVDVADIVAILEIMKNGTKELQSIKWASTTAVNGTTGTTPSLGDITLTYNDGTTGTVAYNASGVTLFTDAAGNTPFSNANAGTFNVWAKYCGMTTTNSKQVTLSAPVAGTYYWYVGRQDTNGGEGTLDWENTNYEGFMSLNRQSGTLAEIKTALTGSVSVGQKATGKEDVIIIAPSEIVNQITSIKNASDSFNVTWDKMTPSNGYITIFIENYASTTLNIHF